MSIEAMKSDIQAKTKETVARINQEAKAEAERIIEEGRRRADENKSKLSETLKRELDEQVDMGGAIEEVKWRKIIADLKQEAIDGVFKDAAAALRVFVKEESYRKMLSKLVTEAVEGLEGDVFVLTANTNDRELLKKSLHDLQRRIFEKGKQVVLKLDDGAIDCIGGVVAYTENRKRSFNNTFDARLMMCRDETWKIAQILFG
jgi:V/A-type H+-transporting ATPase subunit E